MPVRGGLAGALPDNETALSVVVDGIHRAGLVPGAEVSLAVDVAANQLWDGHAYCLELPQDERLDERAWLERLARWFESYPVVSLEDVLAEDAVRLGGGNPPARLEEAGVRGTISSRPTPVASTAASRRP